MVLVGVGMDHNELLTLGEKYFGDMERATSENQAYSFFFFKKN